MKSESPPITYSLNFNFSRQTGVKIAYQKQYIEDGEALQDVGEAGLQLHALLREHKQAQYVPCNISVPSY